MMLDMLYDNWQYHKKTSTISNQIKFPPFDVMQISMLSHEWMMHIKNFIIKRNWARINLMLPVRKMEKL